MLAAAIPSVASRYSLPSEYSGRARPPAQTFVLDAGLPEPDPGAQDSREAQALGQRPQRLDHAPIHQAEVAAVERQPDVGQRVDQTVEPPISEPFDGVFFPLPALPEHHVVLADLVDHLEDDVRGILEIGVEDGDEIGAGVIQTGADGVLVTEVARQAVERGRRAGVDPVGNDPRARVRTAIVDEQVTHAGEVPLREVRRAERFVERVEQRAEHLGLVVDRDDDVERLHDSTAVAVRGRTGTRNRPRARLASADNTTPSVA